MGKLAIADICLSPFNDDRWFELLCTLALDPNGGMMVVRYVTKVGTSMFARGYKATRIQDISFGIYTHCLSVSPESHALERAAPERIPDGCGQANAEQIEGVSSSAYTSGSGEQYYSKQSCL